MLANELTFIHSHSLQDAESDPTLFCLSVKKNRFYLFTRREPEEVAAADIGRDVFNEKPSKEEELVAVRCVERIFTVTIFAVIICIVCIVRSSSFFFFFLLLSFPPFLAVFFSHAYTHPRTVQRTKSWPNLPCFTPPWATSTSSFSQSR